MGTSAKWLGRRCLLSLSYPLHGKKLHASGMHRPPLHTCCRWMPRVSTSWSNGRQIMLPFVVYMGRVNHRPAQWTEKDHRHWIVSFAHVVADQVRYTICTEFFSNTWDRSYRRKTRGAKTQHCPKLSYVLPPVLNKLTSTLILSQTFLILLVLFYTIVCWHVQH